MSASIEYTQNLLQELADATHDRQKWIERGRTLAQADFDHQFAIGDWLIEGEDRWTRIYDEAVGIFTGYTKETLQVFASVARNVEPLIRVKDLSWAHHRAVMKFGSDTQEKLLLHATEHRLSLRDFRLYIRDKYPPIKPEASSDDWKKEWEGMPDYDQPDLPPFRTIKVHFERQEDVDRFAEIIAQQITPDKKYVWFPKKEQKCWADKQYIDAENEGTRGVAG